MEYSNKRFGDALLKLLKNLEISQAELARRLEITSVRMHVLTNQKAATPELIERIAEALDVSPDYFLEYRLEKIARLYEDELAKDREIAKLLKQLDKKVSSIHRLYYTHIENTAPEHGIGAIA